MVPSRSARDQVAVDNDFVADLPLTALFFSWTVHTVRNKKQVGIKIKQVLLRRLGGLFS